MANKLYEEESIQAIADAIRTNAPESTGDTTYTVAEMPEGIAAVYSEGYSDGYNASGNTGGESVGLNYTVNADDTGYLVSGKGTCTDAKIVIPETYKDLPVTGIAMQAFMYDSTVKTVILPDSVTSIGNLAFAYTSIEKIYIPLSVTTIPSDAFALSTSITIYCEASSAPDGWDGDWSSGRPVVWNAVKDIWGINDKFNSLSSSEGSNNSGSTSSLEMPLIRFIGLRGDNILSNLDGEEYPVQFTVEVIAGSLQVGDALQICGMRTFCESPKNLTKKRKLRRFAEYVITEDDLDKRVLTLTVNPTKNALAHLGHNNRQSGGPSIYYFRIRRPTGQLQANESGMTVNAKFSNVVPVSMLNVVGSVNEETGGKEIKINVI